MARAAIVAAYVAEYGLAAAEQSALNFLLFIHADRALEVHAVRCVQRRALAHSRWQRPHRRRASPRSLPGQISSACAWCAYGETRDGRIELTFETAAATETRRARRGGPALPFCVLRDVDLRAAWPAGAEAARDRGARLRHQCEDDGRLRCAAPGSRSAARRRRTPTSPITRPPGRPTPPTRPASRGVLTDYSSGARGASLKPAQVQQRQRCSSTISIGVPGRSRGGSPVRGGKLRRAPRTLAVEPAERAAATPAIGLASSRRSPATRARPSATCISPASTPTRSTSGRGSWKARRCRASMSAERILKGA